MSPLQHDRCGIANGDTTQVHDKICTMKQALARGAVALIVLALVGTPTQNASAHSTGGSQPTSQRSIIETVDPQIEGVTLRVIDFGSKIELENLTKSDVVVAGYDGEPYLKIGPTGSFENQLSPATYINKARDSDTNIPGDPLCAQCD